jgi:DNA-binding NarL/FixJ family response regulator
MPDIRLLLVDDQVLFVESLKNVLEMRTDDIKVIGIAYNGKEAIEFIEHEKPDIVLMDVRMPVLDGVEASREIRKRFPDVSIMILTTIDDEEYVQETLRFGVKGYVLKDIPPAELIVSIRAIKGGIIQISPLVAHKLVQGSLTPDRLYTQTGNEPEWLSSLSYREHEVLKLLIAGFSNKEIAGKLRIAEQTVKNYVSIIYEKLGVRDRVHVLKKVIEAGVKL